MIFNKIYKSWFYNYDIKTILTNLLSQLFNFLIHIIDFYLIIYLNPSHHHHRFIIAYIFYKRYLFLSIFKY